MTQKIKIYRLIIFICKYLFIYYIKNILQMNKATFFVLIILTSQIDTIISANE